jgi:transaldolase
MADNRIKQLLREQGQSAWQDDISRDMLNEGSIRTAIEEIGIRGLTSNPTIFEKAIAAGSAYD